MTLISRYILGQFLATIGVSLCAFVGIFYIVDLISQLDKFLDLAVEPWYIFLYYFYFLPYIVVLTLPVSLLLSCLFTFGQLARHGELTAMKASGLSLYRIVRPILAASIVVSLGVFAAGEWIIPQANQRRERVNLTHVERFSREARAIRNHVFYRGEGGRQFFLRLYNGIQQRATDITVIEIENSAIVKTVRATEMDWIGDRWRLRKGAVWQFYPKGALRASTPFDSLDFADWRERPENFLQGQKRPEEMDYRELKGYIRTVQQSGGDVQGYLVDLNLKLAFPCANLIIVLFGSALASHVRKSGIAFGFAASIGVCFLYWGLLRFSQALGHSGALTPIMAAWGPNILFAAIGLLLLIRAPK